MPIELSQFELKTATFEIRYLDAFLIWDRAGAIWNEVAADYPNLQVDKASPQEVKVVIDQSSQAEVGINQSRCTVAEPKSNLSDLQNLSDTVCRSLLSLLEISVLTRIGMRLIYSKTFETRRAAAEFILAQSSLPGPKDKILNVEGTVLDPQRALRFEGETLGFTVVLKAQETTLTIPLPTEFRDIVPLKTTRASASLDIDYYTTGSTPISAFDARALISSWHRIIKRDIAKVF
ncbi:hypothetical protein [Methyloceanibacter sp.]|uniref:hypothetical protein n=1 Tax=Methyloceanibacter sp. TaxID=1965321 RepID=UPI003D6CE2DF